MSLIAEQAVFLQDVCRLIAFANEQGFIVTGGELYRTPEQQEIYVKAGKSKTSNSQHLKRCAIDLNFFLAASSLIMCCDKVRLQPVGDFWESLDKKNKWGGNFKSFLDCPHFERTL